MASRVASGATMKLLRVARPHSSELNKLSYHCMDQPGIGYDKNELALNDNGMMTRIGSSKNSKTPRHSTRSAYQPTLSASVA